MGFVNIGGNIIHTSAIGSPIHGTPSLSSSLGLTGSSGVISISGTNSTTTTTTTNGQYLTTWGGSTINYTVQKITYHVLGEDIEVESSYSDSYLAVAISTLNILGKPFYEELKKNSVFFPKEIEEYLEVKFKVLERDRKINEVLK